MSKNKTSFKKGHKGIGNVFRKGHKHSQEVKDKISKIHKGRKLTEEHKRKIGRKGSKNASWKGDKATYSVKHLWIVREKGKAKDGVCVDCGNNKDEGSRLEWSNKDHKYKRNVNDYDIRCKKCHIKFDKLIKNL
jgi:hypothetical protein